MNRAEEMFKELGYVKKEEKSYIRYNKFGNVGFGEIIDFDLKNRKFRLTNKTCQGNVHYRYGSIQELQAINEKCKELGWLDNKTERRFNKNSVIKNINI